MGIPSGVGHLTMDLEYPPEPGRGPGRRQFRHHFLAIRPSLVTEPTPQNGVTSDGKTSNKEVLQWKPLVAFANTIIVSDTPR